jgi:hypothetical protein
MIARGDLSTAEHYVTKALSEGTPMTHYEARLARAELAVARGDTDAQAVVLEMLDLAQAGNLGVIAARLRVLAAELSRAS